MWMDKKYEIEDDLDEHYNLAKVAKWEFFQKLFKIVKNLKVGRGPRSSIQLLNGILG